MKCVYAFLCCFLTLAVAAKADTFSFSVVGNTVNGSGSLTAVPDAAIANAFDVTAISGTLNGSTITGLLPCATYSVSNPCSTAGLTVSYDDLIYPRGVSSFFVNELDDRGLGFLLGSQAVDIAASGSHTDVLTYSGEPGDATPISVGFTVAATPEPGGLVLLGSGLLGVVLGFRRRVDAGFRG